MNNAVLKARLLFVAYCNWKYLRMFIVHCTEIKKKIKKDTEKGRAKIWIWCHDLRLIESEKYPANSI